MPLKAALKCISVKQQIYELVQKQKPSSPMPLLHWACLGAQRGLQVVRPFHVLPLDRGQTLSLVVAGGGGVCCWCTKQRWVGLWHNVGNSSWGYQWNESRNGTSICLVKSNHWKDGREHHQFHRYLWYDMIGWYNDATVETKLGAFFKKGCWVQHLFLCASGLYTLASLKTIW